MLNGFKNSKRDLTLYGGYICALIALLQLSPGFINYMYDIDGQYSGSKDAVQYLKENRPESKIIVGYESWAAISVLPYLSSNIKIYTPQCDRFGTYFIYDSCFTKVFKYKPEYVTKIAYDKFRGRLQDVIFLLNFSLTPPVSEYMELLYKNPEEPVYSSEMFYIYKFKKGLK